MPIKVIKSGIGSDPKNKRQGCPKKGRLMGFDLGKKTIGVAISDEAQSIITPLITIERKKLAQDFEALEGLIKEYGIRSYVIGWPLNMDGSLGGRCDMVRSFADEMLKNPEIFGRDPWIGLYDERLSTKAVDEFVDGRVDMPKSARKGAKESGLTDKLAASVILDGFLNGS